MMALVTIISSSLWSAAFEMSRNTSNPVSHTVEDDDELVEIQASGAIIFLISVSAVLLILFYFMRKWFIWVLIVMFCIGGISGTHTCIVATISRLFKGCDEMECDLPIVEKVSVVSLVVLPFCIVFAVFWVVHPDASYAWFMQDILDIKFANQEHKAAVLKSMSSTVVTHLKKDDIVSIHKRRGVNSNQSHNQWLSSISQAPNVISMSFVPITSLLAGVRGSGFLSHAVNRYLRYKPPIEELHLFLEFQLPRQWAPVFGEIPLGPQSKKHRSFPSLQFTLMGPRLFVNTAQGSQQARND